MIRLALVGYDQRGVAMASAIGQHTEDCQLVCVCDIIVGRCLEAQLAYPHIKIATHYQWVLEQPDIGGIIVTVPSELHYPITIQAILSGKHVFLPKLNGLSDRQWQRVKQLLERYPVKVVQADFEQFLQELHG